MAYRTEKMAGGRTALVIDGWENGIADSPYKGISSIKNLNISFLTGATYVNYKRLPVTLSGSMGKPMFYTQSPGTSPTYYILDDKGQVWVGTNGATTWALLTGNHTASNGLGYGIAYFKNYLFVFGPNYVDVCGDGTGTGGITSSNWADIGSSGYYYINQTGVQLTAAPNPGDTTLTLSNPWGFTSGQYQVIIGNGLQTLTGTFTNGDVLIQLVPTVSVTTAIDTISVNMFTATSPENHMALVAINDVLYFCNGNTIGSIGIPTTNTSAVFKVTDFATMAVNFAALTLKDTDRSIWLTELNQNLVIAVQNFIYQWDKTSTIAAGNVRQSVSASPINENPSRMMNILNNIYIFAGQKGNVYITNGYSVSLFKKIPDSFLGVIDPYWVIGGMMFHRNKLWFGVGGSDSSGNTRIQGIMSLVLSTGISNSSETVGAINFESQNSYGATPSSTADATGVLIDLNANPATGIGTGGSVDRYASAYYTSGAGGIDYNDSTLWANYEPVIETDLIPVGTFLESRTFENFQYKLDKPLANGDSIRFTYRTSVNGSYTALGTSAVTNDSAAPGTTTATSTATTQVLSDNFNSEILNAQWVQFKVEFKCAASSSSFIRLRELRLNYLLP